MKTLKHHWCAATLICGIGALIVMTTANLFADAPVLSITSLGTNAFSITVTNASPTATYQLQWTPVLANPNYPWTILSVGSVGQSNFVVEGSGYSVSFFKVTQGTDADGDGVPDWQDAAPFDPSIGVLQVFIDSPLNGSTLN